VSGSYLIMPVLLVVFISFLIVRAAAVLLIVTGMEPSRARFQALSAFTRTGFTTREAETVVRNPSRRRVIIWLMILGNAGIITVMVTATSAFVQSHGIFIGLNLALLIFGIAAIWLLARYSGLGVRWERFIIRKFSRSAETEDLFCEDLTHLAEGYGLQRVTVSPGSRLAGRSVGRLGGGRSYRILGLERDTDWLPLPRASEVVRPGDSLILFGRLVELRSRFAQKSPGVRRETRGRVADKP
jgi:hypothetical protein